MTGLLPEREFSRRSFVKGTGALLVGFSALGAGLAGKAEAALDPFASNGPTNLLAVDSFIAIHSDNTASIMTGGSDQGEGTATGWLMLAGEELGMDMTQLKYVPLDTNLTPNNVDTNSSQGTKIIGPQIRAAAAYARQALLGLASTNLGVQVGSLTVASGVVSGGGKTASYGSLIGDKLFNVTMPSTGTISFGTDTPAKLPVPSLVQGTAPTKPTTQYTLVGTRVPRIDIPPIVTGAMTYIQNVRVPGMLHGRVVWPRGQAAWGSGAAIVSVDESSIGHIPSARIVRKNNFLGVVAPLEYDAIQAAAQLKVVWADPPTISGSGNLWKKMRADDAAGLAPTRDSTIASVQGPIGNVNAALASAAHMVSQSYGYAYNTHGPIGPGCSIADVTPNGALILTAGQSSWRVRLQIASILGLATNLVRVVAYPGSSHYGEAVSRYDNPLAASIMSQLVGAPVRLQFMRWDEIGTDNYGPAHLIDLKGGVDANGNITAWQYTSFASPYVVGYQTGGGTTQELIGTRTFAPGLSPVEDTANGMQYNLPNWRVLAKTLPLVGNYFKTSYMRSSHSTQTTWGTEIFADELAHAAGMDPIAFRRQNVSKTYTDRYLAVLDALQLAANWQPRVAASNLSSEAIVTGRGISAGPRSSPLSFSGVVVNITVNKKTGKITANHIYAALDSGLSVNPASMENQIVGQVVMGTSRAILEGVEFNTQRVTSLDWVSYPLLRFKDHPSVTPIVINRSDQVMSGAGDYPQAHVPAAIANAFFDATGVRIRETPMSPARVRAVLAANGGGTLGVT